MESNGPTRQRVVVWFSCGAASACAAKLASEKYADRDRYDLRVVYCDTLAFEHEDNPRFMRDVETWIGLPIEVVRSEKYADIFDVFRKTRYLVGVRGARCTSELKKKVREAYQEPGDIQILGMTADGRHRIERFEDGNNGLLLDWILEEADVTKAACYAMLQDAGIELPMMYRLGYNNNNCIGCVKGQSGYWNKIRRDFPEAFARMAAMERELGVAINKRYEGDERIRVFLDELDPDAGAEVPLPDIECGAFCVPPPGYDPGFADEAPLFHGEHVRSRKGASHNQ